MRKKSPQPKADELLAQKKSVEIVTHGFNPSRSCQQFRRDPNKVEMRNSESAAVCKGGDACAKKTVGLRGGMCVPFSSACVLGKHREGSDSEKLSLLLSLASEKEESR